MNEVNYEKDGIAGVGEPFFFMFLEKWNFKMVLLYECNGLL